MRLVLVRVHAVGLIQGPHLSHCGHAIYVSVMPTFNDSCLE